MIRDSTSEESTMMKFLLPTLTVSLFAVGCTQTTLTPYHPDAPHVVRVQGFGEVDAVPDVARVRLGVESRASSASEAMTSANGKMSAIIASAKRHGIAEKDIRTTEMSVYFERDHTRPPEPVPAPEPTRVPSSPISKKSEAAEPDEQEPDTSKPAGWFVVRNNVEVTVREIDALGKVLGDAMNAGANNVHHLQLAIDRPAPLEQKARLLAVQDAREKAQALAREAGVELGSVMEIISAGASPGPRPSAYGARLESQAADVPTEGGSIRVSETVQVVFAIKPE